jgi:hypothetical protein
MLKFWHGNEFLVELLLDLGNYSFYCLIFLIFKRYKLISNSYFLLLCILMTTPFLINNSFIPWTMIPDQSRYFQTAYNFRENLNLFGFLEMRNLPDIKTSFSSYIFAFSPILNIETFKSIGFFNRFLLLSTITYFIKKIKFPSVAFIILITSPSLTFFSSVSLREILVLVFMLWFVHFYLDRKVIPSIIFFVLLTLIKIQNVTILVFFIYLNELMRSKDKRKLIFFTLVFLVPLFLIFNTEILDQLNFIREGLFKEAHGSYRGLSSENTYTDLDYNFELISTTINSLFRFSLSPILDISSLLKLIIMLETLLLYSILLKGFLKSENKNIAMVWMMVFFFSFLMYSLVLFNDGTIHRYRTILIFFTLIGYNIHIKQFYKKNV